MFQRISFSGCPENPPWSIPPWWIPPIKFTPRLVTPGPTPELPSGQIPPRWIATWFRVRVRVRVREFDQVGIYRGAIYQGRIWPGGNSPGRGGANWPGWGQDLIGGNSPGGGNWPGWDFPSTLFQKTSQWMFSYLLILYLLIAFKANFLV